MYWVWKTLLVNSSDVYTTHALFRIDTCSRSNIIETCSRLDKRHHSSPTRIIIKMMCVFASSFFWLSVVHSEACYYAYRLVYIITYLILSTLRCYYANILDLASSSHLFDSQYIVWWLLPCQYINFVSFPVFLNCNRAISKDLKTFILIGGVFIWIELYAYVKEV